MQTNIIHCGDCIEVMRTLPDCSVDAVVTDPPYGLGFMGKAWDTFDPEAVSEMRRKADARQSIIANPVLKRNEGKVYKAGIARDAGTYDRSNTGIRGYQAWCYDWAVEALRVLKPGGYLLASNSPRMYHRMACAVEDAGFEIRDQIMWLYGCLSDDTELLIDGRWEPYHKASLGGRALGYNISDGTFSWQQIERYYEYEYDDTAYSIQSDHTDQLVSRNHRCIVERSGVEGFEFAEITARERKIRVPVLESVSALLNDLPDIEPIPSGQEQDVQQGMLQCADREGQLQQQPSRDAQRKKQGDLCGMRQDDLPQYKASCAGSDAGMQSTLQRDTTRGSMEAARPQGAVGMVSGNASGLCSQDDGAKQSGVEGRGDVLSQERKLQANQVCSLPSGISGNGTQGRLCDGTSADRRAGNGQVATQNGSGTSREPRSARQCAGESNAIQQQPSAQTTRGTRYTRTDMARIKPRHYKGIVWCIGVATGAFVARRNGKIFITGNSGFPKGHRISHDYERRLCERRPDPDDPDKMDWFYLSDGERMVREPPFRDADANEWAAWNMALKPAHEPIVMARKPLSSIINVVADIEQQLRDQGVEGDIAWVN